MKKAFRIEINFNLRKGLFAPVTQFLVLTLLNGVAIAIVACSASHNGSKTADTGYINPNGVEVEVDIEADVTADASQIAEAPVYLGQFALTYMQKNYSVYLESIVTDASSPKRVEWLIDGVWHSGTEAATLTPTKMTHFRIRGMNAVLLRNAIASAQVGKVFDVKAPVNPYTLFDQVAATCADPDEEDHWDPTNDIYWYMWNPNLAGCKANVQPMKVTISRTFTTHASYPEYSKLLANKKITVVSLFTAMDENYPPLPADDLGLESAKEAADGLIGKGFTEVAAAPVGRRFSKTINGIEVEVDVYSPLEFAGLGDEAHFDNFQKALNEHQIVVFDGHSMLGNSDFWKRATYPQFYQIILYGGCLGYQYYVRPIVQNKGGWDNLDIVSSVFEVGATGVDVGAPFLTDLLRLVEGGKPASWQEILTDIHTSVDESEDDPSALPDTSFGVSGARDSCWSPDGAKCPQ